MCLTAPCKDYADHHECIIVINTEQQLSKTRRPDCGVLFVRQKQQRGA
jgi:hypothetical protein